MTNLMTIKQSAHQQSSVTRLGDFWNFLVTSFRTKVAKNIKYDLGCFENIYK